MKWGKVALVIVGALIVTALGIDAADTLRGNDGTLLSQVIKSTDGGCPSGMAAVAHIGTISCVDIYEVSPSASCASPRPGSIVDSKQNIEDADCSAESKKDAEPWRFITRDQAMQMCARGGKRLPTSKEWYELSLGLPNPDQYCNVSSGTLKKTGEKSECRAPSGTYDTVGNVWEWVSDDVVLGVHDSQSLAETGYVAQVNANGMTVVATTTEQELFDSDYSWSRSDGTYGIIRGGYYNSGKDAGIYSVHADTPPTTAGTAIGFRCIL